MLDEWALNHSKLKKRLAARLFENRHLKGASCLHALCPPEASSIRKYGFEGPIATIPNGIELPEVIQKEEETTSRKIPGSSDESTRRKAWLMRSALLPRLMR